MAALTAALAAALLEKLVVNLHTARALRRIRRTCLGLMQQDAQTFARAIQASRANDRRAFRVALQAATDVQQHVLRYSQTIQTICRRVQRSVKPQLRSDLRCVKALAVASAHSAHTFIQTNRAWLNDRKLAKLPRRRLNATTATTIR